MNGIRLVKRSRLVIQRVLLHLDSPTMFCNQNRKYFKQRMTINSWISFELACRRTAWRPFHLLRAGNASLEGSGRLCSLWKQMYIRGFQSEVCNAGHLWSRLKFHPVWARLFFSDQFYIADRATERGGQGGTMSPGPMDFKGPMGFKRAHSNDTMKSACEAWRPLLFWRSPKFGRKNR